MGDRAANGTLQRTWRIVQGVRRAERDQHEGIGYMQFRPRLDRRHTKTRAGGIYPFIYMDQQERVLGTLVWALTQLPVHAIVTRPPAVSVSALPAGSNLQVEAWLPHAVVLPSRTRESVNVLTGESM
jgi:hypothetical protein